MGDDLSLETDSNGNILYPTSNQIEKINPSKSNIWVYLIAGFFIILVIISLTLFLILKNSNVSISETDLTQGYTSNFSKDKKVTFEILNETHSFTINSISNNSIEITIASDPIRLNISVGEEKKFDLDGDGNYDLSVKLNGVEGGKPNLTIIKIFEVVSKVQNQVQNNSSNQGCIENWNCGSWSACVVGSQTRTCTDSNSCGTLNSKPLDFQTCISDNSNDIVNSCEFKAMGNFKCVDGNVNQEYQNTDCTKYWGETITCGTSYKCAELPGNNVTCVSKDYGKICSSNDILPCGGGLRCNLGKCVTESELVSECQTGQDCGTCENCSSGYNNCVTTQTQSGFTYKICKGECLFDDDCKSGYECSSNKCVQIPQQLQVDCTSNWECSPWGACIGGTQILEAGAICNDLNNCPDSGMPPYQRSC